MENANILREEFIGKKIRVHGSGLEGTILDESKNSFLIEDVNDMRKRILKQNTLFDIFIEQKALTIDGNDVLNHPEGRIKIKK